MYCFGDLKQQELTINTEKLRKLTFTFSSPIFSLGILLCFSVLNLNVFGEGVNGMHLYKEKTDDVRKLF